MNSNNNPQNRTLTIKKTFDAPVKLVWDAWTQSDQIIEWWAPQGIKINVVEHHVSFFADGDKTNFEFSVVHETEEYTRAQEKMGFYNGWGSALNRMEEVINKQFNK